MLKVNSFVRRLLPDGTRPRVDGNEINWTGCPLWPPDLFAVTASLIDRSGCYSHPRYSGDEWGPVFFGPDYVGKVQLLAQNWGMHLVSSEKDSSSDLITNPETREIGEAWKRIIEEEAVILPIRGSEQAPTWCDDAILLMAVADEASAGLGFFCDEERKDSYKTPFISYWFTNYVIKDVIIFLRKVISVPDSTLNDSEKEDLKSSLTKIYEGIGDNYVNLIDTPKELLEALEDSIELPYLTNSLCQLVPSTEVCVQPKTRISEVGCTIRSLSHHLAILPPISQVETFWRVPQSFEAQSWSSSGPRSLNLLLIPFPYHISASCFEQGNPCLGSDPRLWQDGSENHARFFEVDQRWLKVAGEDDRDVTAEELIEFICCLVDICKRETNQIHGIVLPELALNSELANSISTMLRTRIPHLEFFITGICTGPHIGRGPKNAVHTTVYSETGRRTWEQAKHHRWKLDRFQISRYNLGSSLDPHFNWWEGIDLSPRECYFGVFRHEACLTALVCEDLARLDPVQAVVRSVAPNLCVCLLMDGPQLENRWPGRYATVLADDPGCAVLTLTSLGLLNRTHEFNNKGQWNIALWKEPRGERAVELAIPIDHHAMLLTLSHKNDCAFTIDGRPDITKTVALSRSASLPIKLDKFPDWMQH